MALESLSGWALRCRAVPVAVPRCVAMLIAISRGRHKRIGGAGLTSATSGVGQERLISK